MNSEDEKKWIEENFKAGEFCTLTIVVKLTELASFLNHMSNSGLNLAVLPSAKAEIDFATEDGENDSTITEN